MKADTNTLNPNFAAETTWQEEDLSPAELIALVAEFEGPPLTVDRALLPAGSALYGELVQQARWRSQAGFARDCRRPNVAQWKRERAALAGLAAHLRSSPRHPRVEQEELSLLGQLEDAVEVIDTVLSEPELRFRQDELDVLQVLNTQLIETVCAFANDHDPDGLTL